MRCNFLCKKSFFQEKKNFIIKPFFHIKTTKSSQIGLCCADSFIVDFFFHFSSTAVENLSLGGWLGTCLQF